MVPPKSEKRFKKLKKGNIIKTNSAFIINSKAVTLAPLVSLRTSSRSQRSNRSIPRWRSRSPNLLWINLK